MNSRSASKLKALQDSAGEAADFLQLLANRKRLLVLCELMVTGELSVNDLAHAVGLGQSALSQHLAKLRAERLVCTRREAQTIYYRLAKDARIRKILPLLTSAVLPMSILQIVLSLICGGAVGLSLGLVGGGGSILAVPMMVYVVGISSPHVAIGTSAVAVSVNALFNLFGHARDRNVKWPCAIVFAAFGIAGAALGAMAGKAVDGGKLLAIFGVLMIAIAGLMLRPRRGGDDAAVHLGPESARRLLPPLAGTGFGAGAMSGFFGIGGGFLIVPGLVSATSMPLLSAVGSSLVSVAAFGATTALTYAVSGFGRLADGVSFHRRRFGGRISPASGWRAGFPAIAGI